LLELPPSTRKLIAWASLLGTTFSWDLIKKLLNAKSIVEGVEKVPLLDHDESLVSALNGALDVYVLMPADQEARFRFSHDRYLAAAQGILNKEWDTSMMHYVIARLLTMHEIHADDTTIGSKALYTRSRHICLASELIKAQEPNRAPFRDVLYQAVKTWRK